ncbi:MAG TPA: dihydrodipicolinate synthase family protein [Pyrinomonadaceae bacterium]|nr:dihydrodipicolinate synthase family protein [Pyrinomonadaceae bacterium]
MPVIIPRILQQSSNNARTTRLSKTELSGLLLPITTPFTAEGELDLSALQRNISKWNKTGIRGYVMLGSTGERVHLDEREYEQVITTARTAIPEELLLIAGAGQHSTRLTINEISRVSSIGGVDGVLVLTPHFYRPGITQQLLEDHYRAVADASPLPVILYSMPPFTGVKIEPSTVGRLSSHENIIGIKDSSADVAGLKQTVDEVEDEFAVLTGNGTILDQALRAGACGAILAVGCVAPHLASAIIEATKAGDFEEAAKLQVKLTPLATAVTTTYGIGGLKLGLDLAGYEGGYVRAPLKMPDAQARDEIEELLKAAMDQLGTPA